MHGGTTAIFAVAGPVAARARRRARRSRPSCPASRSRSCCTPRSTICTASPRLATLAVIIVLPPLLLFVFQRSERAVGAIGSGTASTPTPRCSIRSRRAISPIRRRASTSRRCKTRFKGPVVADLLCYLRLHTELALRAKGILMMRENGFEPRSTRRRAPSSSRCATSSAASARPAGSRCMPLLHAEQQGRVAAQDAGARGGGRDRKRRSVSGA